MHDPTHMASNLVQFINSIETAIQSVESVEKVWNAAAETKDHLQKINERVQQVNRLIQNAAEIEAAVTDLIEMADMVTLVAKQIKKASTISSATSMWTESTTALNMFSQCLTRAVYQVEEIKRAAIDSYEVGYKMVDAERKAFLGKKAQKLAEEKAKMEAAAVAMKKVYDSLMIQAEITDKYLSGNTHKELMGPADIAALTTANCELESNGLENIIVATSAFFGDEESKRKKKSADVAAREVGGIAGSFFTIYYTICAIMGLIGAGKVYSKVQLGEDFGRTVAVWLGGAVGGYFFGVLVQGFFF
jgi:ferritin